MTKIIIKLYPMLLASSQFRPPSGTKAILLKTDRINASSDITLKSHAKAKAAPIPAAGPLIEAMVIFGISIRFLNDGK